MVAGIVALRERSASAVERRQPAGSLTMIRLSLGDRLTVTDRPFGAGGGRNYDSFVAGFQQGHSGTRYDAGQNCLQVYLTPRGVQRILGVPGSELGQRLVDLNDVAPLLGGALIEQLVAMPDWAARLARLETALKRMAAHGRDSDPLSDHLWQQITAARGRIRVRDLVTESGWSHRRVIARIHAHVGAKPKAAADVVRFEHAMHELRNADDSTGLAELALRNGYADQSHLTREMVRYTSATPAQLRRSTIATAWTALGRRP